MFSVIALFAAGIRLAEAGVLEPQVRIHAGLNYVLGPSPVGATAGLDARLTRVLAIDLGGFGSFVGIPESEYVREEEEEDYFHLRHGVYFAPGLRIPHPQPRAFAWDVFVRGGAGVLWYTDTQPASLSVTHAAGATTASAGGFGGIDLMVRIDRFGVRGSAKGWVYEAQHQYGGDPTVMIQPQFCLEGLVEF
jgi:hypothetical protein